MQSYTQSLNQTTTRKLWLVKEPNQARALISAYYRYWIKLIKYRQIRAFN